MLKRALGPISIYFYRIGAFQSFLEEIEDIWENLKVDWDEGRYLDQQFSAGGDFTALTFISVWRCSWWLELGDHHLSLVRRGQLRLKSYNAQHSPTAKTWPEMSLVLLLRSLA